MSSNSAYKPTSLQCEIIINSIITIHYFEYGIGFEFLGERHDFWEFLYVDKGTVEVTTDNAVYTIDSGMLIFHKPMEFHAIHALGNKAPNLVAMSFTSKSDSMKFFEEKQYTLNEDEKMLISQIIVESKDAYLSAINIPSVEEMIKNPNAPFGSFQIIKHNLERLLIDLHRRDTSYTKSDRDVSIKQKNNRNVILCSVLNYMEQNINNKLTVKDICQHTMVGKSRLQDVFLKEFGHGVIEHFNRMKMEMAKEYIRNESMNFTEISSLLGFDSIHYFSKKFKKINHMTPTEYALSIKSF